MASFRTSVTVTFLTIVGLATGCVLSFLGWNNAAGAAWAIGMVAFALRMHFTTQWQPFSFSCWVLAFVIVAMYFPFVFQNWGTLEPTKLVSPLIQVIMFGMGTTLSAQDFTRVLVRPYPVAIGMLLQFGVMPITGCALARGFGLPPEIATGVILIGACPGGVASNVITYLARGDVALSVTMTACSTLMSPVMTPWMMQLLAARDVDVDFWEMFMQICNVVVLPTVGGLLANLLLQKFGLRGQWMDRLLSGVAMLAICIVIGIIVAQSREKLLTVGVLLVLISIAHNSIGYFLGYFGARAAKLSETECRTIAIEVGMQNGGMATFLATDVLKSPQAALAGAIFGPWMSISGAVLASWWRRSSRS